jgi:hypothetical protein
MIRPPALPGLPSVAARLRAVLLLAPLVVLAGCGAFPQLNQEDRDATAACKVDADRIYAARNRDELAERPASNAPYSADTLPSNPTAGLSDKYEQDQLMDTCLARSGAGNPATNQAPPH